MDAPGALLALFAVCLGAAMALLSCAGDGTLLDPAGRPLGPPRIEATPDSLRLSLVEETSDTVQVAVTNVGGLPLRVTDVTSPSVALTPLFDRHIELAGGASLLVDVIVVAGAPSPWFHHGAVEISSNDDRNPVATVMIVWKVTDRPEPEINVTPTSLELVVVEGESDTVTVAIQNLGTAELTVGTIRSDAGHVVPQLDSVRVAPGLSADVPVVIDAGALGTGSYASTIAIASNDEDEPVVTVSIQLEVEPSGPFPPALSAIQKNVFDVSCATVGCHSGATPPVGLRLDSGASFGGLVGVRSVEAPDLFLVEPQNPDDSYLVIKIVESDARRIGQRMPLIGLPVGEDEIEVIKRWIAEGAEDN